MFEVKVINGDYNAISESGVRAGQVVACFASKGEAEVCASALEAQIIDARQA